MNDLDIIAGTLSDNAEKLDIIASMLVEGQLTDEQSVVDAYNSVSAAQENANACYSRLISSIDNVPFMVAASADTEGVWGLIAGCQEMGTKADILLNVMASEFGIVAEGEDDAETDEDEEEEDLDDGEDLDEGDEDQITASDLRAASANNVTAYDAGHSIELFDFLD